jgi:2-keto-4-pentenoate hydratase/2-oxohepta-3-ene-1,7-dioic acid hydratase in catechol pathway
MKLVTFLTNSGPRTGRLDGDSIAELGTSLKDILAADPLETLRRRKGLTYPLAKVRLLAPIPDPGLVLSVGMNYRAHLEEMKTPVPEKPAAFTKSVASIIGNGEPIKVPAANPGMLDWEGEFSVIMGKHCHRVKAAKALDHVAGYTLVNDVSARDWVAPVFKAQGTMGAIHAWEHNLLGKMFPTFCPMGPCMVTKDELPDPDDVRIETRLNGQVMQSASTDDLVFGVRELIEYYSQFYLFRPGDVITTGSPSGVGYGRNPKLFMKPGDVVEVEVEQIGILRNPVEA